MFLTFLTIITSIFTMFFLMLWFRTFKNQSFSVLIKKAKQLIDTNKKIAKNKKEAILQGQKPFYFTEKGQPTQKGKHTFEVYAKTQLGAISKMKKINGITKN